MPDATAQMVRRDSRRRAAMSRACPMCGALPNRACIGARDQPRKALHADRHAQARGERPA